MIQKKFRSGFVSLLGRPNVGKSTLLNRMVGQQISITAPKPQTTRNRIKGVIHHEDFQAIVLDTPGVHLPRTELHRRIVNYATSSVTDTDLVFFVTEPFRPNQTEPSEQDLHVLAQIPQGFEKVVLVINKIDLGPQEMVLKTIESFSATRTFLETVPVSALKNLGLENLFKVLNKHLPLGIPYYPEDQITDMPERVVCAELVREQLIRLCQQEIPYGIASVVESFEETEKLIRIFVSIFVEKQSHKKIVIGKGGSMLKKVGENARKKMERLLGNKVFLSLHVKVAKNWVDNPRKLSEFGYGEE